MPLAGLKTAELFLLSKPLRWLLRYACGLSAPWLLRS